MKKTKFSILIFLLIFLAFSYKTIAQNETVITPSNRSVASLEKNLLFYADKRFPVTQSGSVSLGLNYLFDGSFMPVYSEPVDENNPYVLLIENLPNFHVQAGAWIGWSTRFWWPTKFKIEVYNVYNGANTWVTVANEENYNAGSYMLALSSVSVEKIRLTIYRGAGPDNRFGLSEFFFIHPEATYAYDGMMLKYNELGNVGIGTSSPENSESWNKVLEVHGNEHAKILASGSSVTSGIWAHDYGNYGGAPAGGVTGTASNHPFSIITNKLPRLTVSTDGNVGIGTTTPKEKLSVNGTIRSREIKVEASGWPDYVFAKDYILPGLKATESYIQQKGHLPEMPSAKEVERNGLALGEMLKLQQKKIEELTLYLIEQNKRIGEMHKEIQQLKKQQKQ